MTEIKKLLMAILLITGSLKVGIAQTIAHDSTLTDTLPSYDNSLQPVDLTQARPFPIPKINPVNIRLYAKVWRMIDLNDTANNILKIPGHSLMETIMKGIDAGKLTPYEGHDFKKKLTAGQGKQRFADSVLVEKFDNDGNQVSSKMVLNDFNPDRITKFRVEEDVYFDRQRGRLDVRIVALAPMMTISTSANLPENISSTPAFWLYFPQLRYALVKEDVSDPDKGIFDVTLDDVFIQHKFSAYLVKQFSPGGSQTEQLQPGSPEAIRLEQKLTDLKKSIWRNPKGIDSKNLAQQPDKNKEEKQ